MSKNVTPKTQNVDESPVPDEMVSAKRIRVRRATKTETDNIRECFNCLKTSVDEMQTYHDVLTAGERALINTLEKKISTLSDKIGVRFERAASEEAMKGLKTELKSLSPDEIRDLLNLKKERDEKINTPDEE